LTSVVGMVGTGEMGSAVGGAYRVGGARVVTTVVGRTERSRRLAEAAELELFGSLDEVIAAADVVLSVVPPTAARDAAVAIAGAAARTNAMPLVADLNAVSPATVADLAQLLGALELVDGSISGPPPRPGGRTTLYLAGRRAGELATLPSPGLEPRVVGTEVGLASAVKMCTASVYKGHVAVFVHALLTARANGVLEPVLADLEDSYPDLVARAGVAVARAAAKAGRYVGEMREIEATQAAAGLPPELFAGMAEVYAALALVHDGFPPEAVDIDAPLERVLDRLSPSGGGAAPAAEATTPRTT
jgi:3-hydroxyisobutyrate dehydrogenase-like beta-hydroxyacid dehydrogenase